MAVVAAPARQSQPAKPSDAKPAAGLPSAEQLLDKFIQALGGKPALEKLSSRVEKGTFELPAFGITAPIEIYSKAPNKSAFVIDIPGIGMVRQAFDGAVGWAEDPQSGLRDLTGNELSAAKRDAVFHLNLKIKEYYPKLAVSSRQKVNDRETYVLDATPTEGTPEKLYFDVETGLLVRQDREVDSPVGKFSAEVYLADYREIDGVKLPFSVRQWTSAQEFTIKLQEVKHNVPIEDSKFAKPASK
jgi:hypothetical protein